MTDEEAPIAIEEAIIPPASNGSSTTAAVSTHKGDRKLSVVSKQFDVNNDGELDDAEQAMRNMDTTGRGYLTNDKVYALMVEQMKLQKSVFQMKKVIIGLLVFVVILALSNLGTSFASAILAKDSTANDQNELVNKKTGEALGTQTTSEVIVIDEEFDQEMTQRRKLACTGGDRLTGNEFTGVNCDLDGTLMHISDADGKKILDYCERGTTVAIKYTEGNSIVEKQLCPVSSSDTLSFPRDSYNKGKPTEMEIVHTYHVTTLALQAAGHYELTTICKMVCASIYVGVCGVDGNTYSSDCHAKCAQPSFGMHGVTVAYEHECCDPKTEVFGKEECLKTAGSVCDANTDTCEASHDCLLEEVDAIPTPSDPPAAEFCSAPGGLFTCTDENDYCNLDKTGTSGVCSNCDMNDQENSCPGEKYPKCILQGSSAAICGCDVDGDCPSGQTCGIPNTNCVVDVTYYCSSDHDMDFGCLAPGADTKAWQRSTCALTLAAGSECDPDQDTCETGSACTWSPNGEIPSFMPLPGVSCLINGDADCENLDPMYQHCNEGTCGGCTDNSQCDFGSCSSPDDNCFLGVPRFCSVDHDAYFGCGYKCQSL